MLVVEYLVFNDKRNIKSSSIESFNHLLQSDPDIQIQDNKISYSGFTCEYQIEMGKVGITDSIYFHLIFGCNDNKNIELFNKVLRAIKSVLHLTSMTPQILFDGISLYYSNLAYPLISEVENLMRKLITKFMMINVGVDWTKDRVPDDVEKSRNPRNNEATYLRNVDFIQLKNFLFSDNYPLHKENLIQKLKKAKELKDIDLEEIKSLIPIANWDKFFFDKISYPKEQLSDQWVKLYNLRCQVAHNKTFTKGDFDSTETLHKGLKEVLTKAINNLDTIKLSEIEQAELTETVAGSFNLLYGEFIAYFNGLEKVVFELVDSKIERPRGLLYLPMRSFNDLVSILGQNNIIDIATRQKIDKLRMIRNYLLNNSIEVNGEELKSYIEEIKMVVQLLNGYL
jgi:hypothetical protein